MSFEKWSDQFTEGEWEDVGRQEVWDAAMKEATRNQAELLAALEEFVTEVKAVSYSPQFEHTGPLVIHAEALIARHKGPDAQEVWYKAQAEKMTPEEFRKEYQQEFPASFLEISGKQELENEKNAEHTARVDALITHGGIKEKT